jgi:hypothetical protein
MMEHAIDFERLASTESWIMNLEANTLAPWTKKDVTYPASTTFTSVPGGGRQCTWPQKLFLQASLPNYNPWEENALLNAVDGYPSDDKEECSNLINELILSSAFPGVMDTSCNDELNPMLGDVIKSFPPPRALPQKRKSRKHRKQRRGNLVPFNMVPTDEVPDGDSAHNGQTVMIRHIACSYTQEQVMSFLDEAGFNGKYNFVYLPSNPAKNANLGYAFVNFVSAEYVDKCKEKLDGRVFGTSCTQKKCSVALAHMQGYSMISRHATEL